MRRGGRGWRRTAVAARAAAVVAWCGMRGIVTLAAALALPDGGPGAAFPFRDFILFTSFCVVLGTLVLQGMTVRPLMRALALHDDGSVDREARLARAASARAGLGAVHGAASGAAGEGEIVAFLRRKYAARVERAEREEGAPRGARGRWLARVRERAAAGAAGGAPRAVRPARPRRHRRRRVPPGGGGAGLGGGEQPGAERRGQAGRPVGCPAWRKAPEGLLLVRVVLGPVVVVVHGRHPLQKRWRPSPRDVPGSGNRSHRTGWAPEADVPTTSP